MPEKRGGLAGSTARNSIVRVSLSGTADSFIEVPGISTASHTPGEASSDTTVAFEGSFTTVGDTPVGDWSFNVVSFLPYHQSWDLLRQAKRSGNPATFQIIFPSRVVYGPSPAETTASFPKGLKTAARQVTFANQPEQWRGAIIQRGMTLSLTNEMNNAKPVVYSIRSISDANPAVVMVDPLPTPNNQPEEDASDDTSWKAVAASTYSVSIPSMQYEFAANIRQLGGIEATTEAAISSQLTITPTAEVDVPVLV